MKDDSLKVFVNAKETGKLSVESEQYVFNYDEKAEDVVSLTMPIRSKSWTHKELHPIFQMNMPEGALREAIKNAFSKIEKMDDMGFLKIVGSHVLGRVKFGKSTQNDELLSLEEILNSPKKSF